LLFSQRNLHQLVIRTKQRPCVGHALILKEKISKEKSGHGPPAAASHRTSAVKDSVCPLEPFPTLAQIKNQSVYIDVNTGVGKSCGDLCVGSPNAHGATYEDNSPSNHL
jgi:hypothetical protein